MKIIEFQSLWVVIYFSYIYWIYTSHIFITYIYWYLLLIYLLDHHWRKITSYLRSKLKISKVNQKLIKTLGSCTKIVQSCSATIHMFRLFCYNSNVQVNSLNYSMANTRVNTKKIRNFLWSTSQVNSFLQKLWMVIWGECTEINFLTGKNCIQALLVLNFLCVQISVEVKFLQIEQSWQLWCKQSFFNSFQSFLHMFEMCIIQKKKNPEVHRPVRGRRKDFLDKDFITFLNWKYFSNFWKNNLWLSKHPLLGHE